MMKKTQLVLAIATATLTMAGLLIAPQADAKSKKVKKRGVVTSYSYSTSSSAERLASAANNRVEALERQLQNMQYELEALRSQAGRPVSSVDSAKVQELDEWMATTKATPSKSDSKDNMVFFRGGYGRADSQRGGTIPGVGIVNVVNGALTVNSVADGVYSGARVDQDAWYFGAGFDFKLIDDLFGLMRGTDVFAELMFDYKEFAKDLPNSPLSSTAANTAVAATVSQAAADALTPIAGVGSNGLATVNQLTLAASPKVKFFKGQAFRPWLIPVGFELSVISPPSDAITVLNPGMQFGLGADYNLWQNLYVGADARYHYAVDNIDGVNTNGVTAGGYLGIGF